MFGDSPEKTDQGESTVQQNSFAVALPEGHRIFGAGADLSPSSKIALQFFRELLSTRPLAEGQPAHPAVASALALAQPSHNHRTERSTWPEKKNSVSLSFVNISFWKVCFSRYSRALDSLMIRDKFDPTGHMVPALNFCWHFGWGLRRKHDS